MNKLIFLLLIPVLFSCDRIIGEQGNGVIVTENFSTDDFSDLNIEGSFNVILEPGSRPSVTITGDENLLEWIKVDSHGQVLNIETERRLNGSVDIEILVIYTELEEINSSGASNIIAEEQIKTKDLRLEISGAGKIDMALDVERLDLVLSGAALIYLSGQATVLDANMSGAGSLEAFSLQTKNCEVNISGVGSAEVNVSENLEARVSGVGGVEYLGNPEHVVRDVSGIGRIKQAKD